MRNLQRPPTTEQPSASAALYTRKTAPEYLGISLSLLKLLDKNGVVQSVSIGRRKLYRKTDLDAYISAL